MQSKTKALIALIVLLVAVGAVWSTFGINRVERSNVVELNNDPCPIPTPSLAIGRSEDVGTQIVVLGGDGIGQITVSSPTEESDTRILVKRPCHAWITSSSTGRGGYILYGGEDQLYKLVYADKKLARVNFDGFMTDLASDETRVASMSTVDGVSGSQIVVVVTATDSGERIVQYEVPAPYNDAGSAKFSPDSSKLAYGATERDENGDPVKAAVYVIDLTTGEQTVYSTDFAKGAAAYVVRWENNTDILTSEQL